jgi:hypothetical protein
MFASVRAVATLSVSVSNTQVFVSSFDNVYVFLSSKRLGNSRALRGTKQLSTGQVMASVTLTNGRKFTTLFNNAGSVIVPGLMSFDMTTASAIAVDGSSGVVTLPDNLLGVAVLTVTVNNGGGGGGDTVAASTSF